MFWKILLAHFLTDFVLQPDWMIRRKHKVVTLFLHGGIFFVLSLLFIPDSLDLLHVVGLVTLSGIHIIIDALKVRFQPKLASRGATLFLADQGLHLAAISVFVLIFDAAAFFMLGSQFTAILPQADVFLFLTFAVLVVFGGGYFTASVCRGFLNDCSRPGIARAGRYIGILERSLVSVAVLVGRFELIGFLLAAKSIVRHPEMKGATDSTSFAEYFLVGTLTSVSWAFFITLIFQQIVAR